MPVYRRYIILFLICLGMACSTVKPAGSSRFSFVVDGRSYEIISIRDAEGGGANLLIHREGTKAVYRAMDSNRDGVIDFIQSGNISLENANRIYSAGLDIAREQGFYKPLYIDRVFRHTINLTRYEIRTYGNNAQTWFNTFRIGSEDRIWQDSDADGVLDAVDNNAIPPHIQKSYIRILRIAEKEKRLIRTGRFLIIVPGK